METQIKITNEASVCTIDIEGTIGLEESEQFAGSTNSIATYERFREEIEKIKAVEADEIIVNIRSTGGDVNDAMLIYETLIALGKKITTRCYGYTASAATIIAQSASQGCREIASSALYLIHQSSSLIEGNAADLVERIDLLKKTDERIASLYAQRSSREKESFEALMAENGGRGRWLSPKEVVEAGLADTIVGGDESNRRRGVWDRVKEWFLPSDKSQKEECPISDINILHLPENIHPATSGISLEEGQRSVQRSQTAVSDDPSLEGTAPSHNALAYAEDINSLKYRML
jgi:ATP-dependent protease ClpP protease subunit